MKFFAKVKVLPELFELLEDPAARRGMGWVAGLILIGLVLEVFSVALIVPFIGSVAGSTDITAVPVIGKLFARLNLGDRRTELFVLGLVLAISIMLKNGFQFLSTRQQWRFVFGQSARIGEALVKYYARMPYQRHLAANSSQFISRVDRFVDLILVRIVLSYLQIASEGLVMLGILSLLVIMEPVLILPLAVALALLFVVVMRPIQRLSGRLGREDAGIYKERLKALQQLFSSIKEIKVYAREDYFAEQYAALRRRNAVLEAEMGVLAGTPRLIIETVVFSGLVLAVLIALMQDRQGGDIISGLGLLAAAALRLMPALSRISASVNSTRQGHANMAEVLGDWRLRAKDAALIAAEREVEACSFTSTIAFRDLTFTYAGSSHPAIDGLNLDVVRGQTVGIVGSSGAGKSTLMDILLGLLTPTSGQILVDGRPLGNGTRGMKPGMVGFVPQNISLLDDSVRNNVAFGLPPGQINDRQVWAALAMARLDQVVSELPAGLDTVLGERGARLSGGQRQRIGIARALFQGPEFLVMDEATAALDKVTEEEVTQTLDGLHGRKTIIVIAHNLSTIRRCDTVHFLVEGRLADTGTFAELVARNEDFRRMAMLSHWSDSAVGGDAVA